MISVIAPVYNVRPWLGDCLRSIERQRSGTGVELVLVDDASTDGSSLLCDDFAATRPWVTVVRMPVNAGLAAARNAGLARALGTHVAFVDTDDLLPEGALAAMLEVALLTGAPMVAGCLQRFSDPLDASGARVEQTVHYRLLDAHEAACLTLYQRRGMQSSVCGKLFARSLFDSIRFTPGILYEDLDIITALIAEAGQVAATPAVTYLYRTRPGSITATFDRRRLDVLDITARLEAEAEAGRPWLVDAARDRAFSAACNMLALLRRAGLDSTPDTGRCLEIIRTHRRGVLADSHSRLKSRAGALLSMIHPSLTAMLQRPC